MLRLVVVTGSWLPVAVRGWVDDAGHLCFTDSQVAVIAATATGQATLERRLSGGWLQRIDGTEPSRVPSFTATGSEYFQIAGDFEVVHGSPASNLTTFSP